MTALLQPVRDLLSVDPPGVVDPPTPTPEPTPPRAPWVSDRAARARVQADFCNLYDSRRTPSRPQGHRIYTPQMSGAPAEVRADWLRILKAAGGTHIMTATPDGGHYISHIPDVDAEAYSATNFFADPPAYRRYLIELLDAGFTPILPLYDTDTPNPVPLIESHWRPLLAVMGDLLPYCCITAWEPQGWTAREYADVLHWMHTQMPDAVILWHGWPERWSGASHLGNGEHQPDDPWAGNESAFFKHSGGEYIEAVLYQLPHGDEIYVDADEDADDDHPNYLKRWQEGIVRCGKGKNGWRILPICAFETGAYEFYRYRRTSEDVRQIAVRLKRVADKHGVTVTFGNGRP